MDDVQFERIVAAASLAPSVHNTQPARWRRNDWTVEVWCDTSKALTVGDPEQRDLLLSCGAALEATALAMSAEGIGVEISSLWGEEGEGPLRPIARFEMRGAAKADALYPALDARFTHRGPFGAKRLRDWARSDMTLVSDAATVRWLANLNDKVSLDILRDDAFRAELLEWMRLSPDAKGYGTDGMSYEALRLSPFMAKLADKTLGPWWPWLERLRLSGLVTAEAKVTMSAAAIACFHRPSDEHPLDTGRAYLRMWLEATQRGMAGWPMASLADAEESNRAICQRLGLADDRRLVQVIRFGAPTASPPPRARLPLGSLMI